MHSIPTVHKNGLAVNEQGICTSGLEGDTDFPLGSGLLLWNYLLMNKYKKIYNIDGNNASLVQFKTLLQA